MKILVGSTAAGHKGSEASIWLRHAAEMRAQTPHELDFFLASETQPDGSEPRLQAVEAQVKRLGGTVWRFMLDDGSTRIDGGNRLVRICEGRNLVIEYALRSGAQWVLFVDTDIELPPDLLPRLLEIDHPFAGFLVPSYVLSGPAVPGYDFPVQTYMNTAGAWFVHRSLFRRFRFLWDPDDGLTDDPATYRVIREQLGVEQRNRRDVIGRHEPLVSFEHRAGDVRVQRPALAGRPVVAVVPVRVDSAAQLADVRQLLQALDAEPAARVLLMEAGGSPPLAEALQDHLANWPGLADGRLQRIDAPGAMLNTLWNRGWQQALQDFGDTVLVAFIHPAVQFRPGLLNALGQAVLKDGVAIAYPDPDAELAAGRQPGGRTRATRGTRRHGGMTGHCFLIRGDLHGPGGLAMFDEAFRHWYGDDDFAFRVERAGWQQHCVEGLACALQAEALLYRPDDLTAQREADRARLARLWGDA